MNLKTFDIFLYIPHLDLVLTILDNSLVVKEGEDITFTCTPSESTIQVVWDTPIALFSNETLVSYSEPLRHSITIHNATSDHEGNYSCRVLEDQNAAVATAMAFVHVRESELISVIYMHMRQSLYTYRMF